MAKARVKWATWTLEKYPKPEDWYHVRFSDEVHFGWGPKGKTLIIRRRGNGWRGHPDCIQRKETRDSDNPDDRKRVHFWAAVGYNFKSPLVQYTIPTNTNSKMTYQGYVDNVLEPIVANWCLGDEQWCLEEDGDSGHGKPQNSSIVEKWKEDHGMTRDASSKHRYYFNCSQSPDLSIIEDTFDQGLIGTMSWLLN